MITLIILATIAATCFLLIELRKLRLAPHDAETAIHELDLDAMTNLLDDHQATFVRAHLSRTHIGATNAEKAACC